MSSANLGKMSLEKLRKNTAVTHVPALKVKLIYQNTDALSVEGNGVQ